MFSELMHDRYLTVMHECHLMVMREPSELRWDIYNKVRDYFLWVSVKLFNCYVKSSNLDIDILVMCFWHRRPNEGVQREDDNRSAQHQEDCRKIPKEDYGGNRGGHSHDQARLMQTSSQIVDASWGQNKPETSWTRCWKHDEANAKVVQTNIATCFMWLALCQREQITKLLEEHEESICER